MVRQGSTLKDVDVIAGARRDDDIYNYTPWRFRFTIPGHGQSDIVRVLMQSADL